MDANGRELLDALSPIELDGRKVMLVSADCKVVVAVPWTFEMAMPISDLILLRNFMNNQGMIVSFGMMHEDALSKAVKTVEMKLRLSCQRIETAEHDDLADSIPLDFWTNAVGFPIYLRADFPADTVLLFAEKLSSAAPVFAVGILLID